MRKSELLLKLPFADVADVALEKVSICLTAINSRDVNTRSVGMFRGENPGQYILEDFFCDGLNVIAREIIKRWRPAGSGSRTPASVPAFDIAQNMLYQPDQVLQERVADVNALGGIHE